MVNKFPGAFSLRPTGDATNAQNLTVLRQDVVFGGERSSQNETRALSGTTRSRCLARVPAARPATGQPHSAILKIAPFLVSVVARMGNTLLYSTYFIIIIISR